MTYRRSIIAATATLLTGALASLAGNLQAINLDNAHPGIGEHASAVLWPALLLLTVETLIHTPWLATWRDSMTKLAITALVFLVAAWVSYWHLANVLSHYGYDVASRYAGPLAIDAAMVLATLALNRVGHARRGQVANVQDVASAPGQIVATGRTVSTSVQDVAESEAAMRGDFGTPDLWASLERQFADNPAPVSPAPIVRPEVPVITPARKTKAAGVVDGAEALELARAGRQNGLSAGEISDLLAGHYGVSARTIRRQAWWVPTMAGLDSQAG
jgi:hypothetical protein